MNSTSNGIGDPVKYCLGMRGVGSSYRPDLDRERLLNLALTSLLKMLGEAANRFPEEVKTQYSDRSKLQIIAARNQLIHGYDNVDFYILWEIIKNDLADLIPRLEKI